MPPKVKPTAAGPSKKTEQKKKEKVIEDKTFGLKNKKGAKQQKFIQQVEKQVKSGGIHPAKPVEDKKASKEAKLKEQLELAKLIKPVQTQKIEKGTDPKSVVCTFFKQGQCFKGDRCKFSHDLTLERRAEKRSLYVDVRHDDDNMDSWDDEKLKEVVEKKHGDRANVPGTDIICKHFLEAVESSKYGWFWECPAGNKCIYRHALPSGFVLKRDKKKLEDKKTDISLVDLIERERAALGAGTTRVTLHTFLEWKQRKLREKQEKSLAAEEQKRSDLRAGRAAGLSGREMFSFDPALAANQDAEDDDDDETLDCAQFERDDTQYREIQLDLIALEASEADDSGTKKGARVSNGEVGESAAAEAGAGGAAPINESLFLDEELDDELQRLELE